MKPTNQSPREEEPMSFETLPTDTLLNAILNDLVLHKQTRRKTMESLNKVLHAHSTDTLKGFASELEEELNDATLLVQVPVNDKSHPDGGYYESDEAILAGQVFSSIAKLLKKYLEGGKG